MTHKYVFKVKVTSALIVLFSSNVAINSEYIYIMQMKLILDQAGPEHLSFPYKFWRCAQIIFQMIFSVKKCFCCLQECVVPALIATFVRILMM